MKAHNLKLVAKASGGRPAKISRDRILDEARQLGAGELTFPRIAERLGVRPPALYYHFSSREDLIKALALQLTKEFDVAPGNPKGWKPWLEQTTLHFYDFLLANPVLFEVENWRSLARFGASILEAVLETLDGAGYSPKDAGRIWEVASVLAYSHARVLNDIRRAGPVLATPVDQKPVRAVPRTRAMTSTLQSDPRRQLADTLHWLVSSLPRPRS